MKQNFKLKEVLEFGLKVREATVQSCTGGSQLIYDDWDKFCEEHLAEHKNRPKFIKGVKPGNTKLTIDQVNEIIELLDAGKSTTQVAIKYNVTKYCINNIKYGRAWKDVTNKLS